MPGGFRSGERCSACFEGGGGTVPVDISVPTDSTVFQLLNAAVWSEPSEPTSGYAV
jgi:hypothetical protein